MMHVACSSGICKSQLRRFYSLIRLFKFLSTIFQSRTGSIVQKKGIVGRNVSGKVENAHIATVMALKVIVVVEPMETIETVLIQL